MIDVLAEANARDMTMFLLAPLRSPESDPAVRAAAAAALGRLAGRQKRIRFQMYVPVDELPALLAQLRQDFSGSGIQYWVLPVIENGII